MKLHDIIIKGNPTFGPYAFMGVKNVNIYVTKELAVPEGHFYDAFSYKIIIIDEDAENRASVLSEGNIWIVLSITVAAVAGIAVLTVNKKKKPQNKSVN